MEAVLVRVGDVVEEVDGAAEAAEEGEGGKRRPDLRGQQLLGKDDAGEDEKVLDPLAGAERDEEGQGQAHAGASYNRITCGWAPNGPVRLRVSTMRRASRQSRAGSTSR